MAHRKDICSSCGKHTDIAAKLVEDVEKLYCKECRDKELKIMLENFSQVNFYCIRCGSHNVTKNDQKTGISLTDVQDTPYANAFFTCNNCSHKFFVNIEDQGKITDGK